MSEYAWVTWVGWTLAGVGALCVLAWLVRRTAKGSRLCPKCEYDMSATSGLTCPECGRTARNERALQRRRRRGVWARMGVLLMVLGVAAVVCNPGRRDGWASSVPDWVIWPLMPLTDGYADEWIGAFEAARLAQPVNAASDDSLSPARWERLLRTRKLVRDVAVTALTPGGNTSASATWTPRTTLFIGQTLRRARDLDDLGVAPWRVADDILDIAERLSAPAERAKVVEGLWMFGPLRARSVERLRRMLDSTSPEMFKAVFPILMDAVADGRSLTPEILMGFDVMTGEGRSDFVRALYGLVPLDDAVIAKLRVLQSEDPDQTVRVVAGAVIWKNSTLGK